MIIYFAGNVTPPREEILIGYETARLFSFFYHRQDGEFFDEFNIPVFGFPQIFWVNVVGRNGKLRAIVNKVI